MATLIERFVNDPFKGNLDDEWPIWGPILREANHHPQGNSIICSDEDLIEFLSIFFTETVLQYVKSTLDETTKSWLGPRYCKRGVFGSYVEQLVTLLQTFEDDSDADLHSRALQNVGSPRMVVSGDEGDSGGWTSVHRKKRGKTEKREETPMIHVQERRIIGAGGGEDPEGEDPGEGGSKGRLFFRGVDSRQIILSPWTTPEKITGATVMQRKERRQTIRDRSGEFVTDPLVAMYTSSEYDPNVCSSSQPLVHLFHGTRSRNLQSFHTHGILPRLKRNEFSRTSAFYVTNSIRTAYEHVLHNHPRWDDRPDTITVLCFSVPTSVLHGEEMPQRHSKKFTGRWFPTPDDEWQDFCKYNWRDEPSGFYSECDIVTGPISMPSASLGADFGVVQAEGKHPQQIAFTGETGQLWLARHLIDILTEVRRDDGSSESSVTQPP